MKKTNKIYITITQKSYDDVTGIPYPPLYIDSEIVGKAFDNDIDRCIEIAKIQVEAMLEQLKAKSDEENKSIL